MTMTTTTDAPDTAIRVEHISKVYRIWNNPAARLKYPLLQAIGGFLPRRLQPKALRRRISGLHRSPYYHDFHALRDVNFTVKRGEAIGIVGRNGSGKSTLLQIIADTLTPTAGNALVNGRIAALLELGSGFNPEFTGRENVYLNAGILGLTRQETEARFNSIAAFAEIGEFIEQPVRTYSSGMVVRLAFAVAAHVDPDILIVDEALAVGDARFQLKCARAIDRFIEKGVTLLFVSHDPSLVKRICRRAILLEHGRILYEGIPNDVINLYSKLTADRGSAEAIAPDIDALRTRGPVPPPSLSLHEANESAEIKPLAEHHARELLDDERRHIQVSGKEFSYGGQLARIHHIEVRPQDGTAPRTHFTTGEKVEIRVEVEAFDDFLEPIYTFTLKNHLGLEIYGTNTLFRNHPVSPLKTGDRVQVYFRFTLNVMPGTYFISNSLTQFAGNDLVVGHRRYDAVKIDILPDDRSFGIANLAAGIEIRPLILKD
ncbi:ABC-type polysaccharide/polyol phosphate transport system, ATPase component [Opitutaceae bacterium TAV1]|nr:ABC-type polysaccharide/polyol phosphate transport system, ATPase component [Opitutaceae bacterium TAV1]